MTEHEIYWDKVDLPDDLREMGNNLFPGIEDILRCCMLWSAARRIEFLEHSLLRIAEGDGIYGAQAHEYKQIARKALGELRDNSGSRPYASPECNDE